MNWKNEIIYAVGWFSSAPGFGLLFISHFTEAFFWLGLVLAILGSQCFIWYGRRTSKKS